MFAMVLFPNNLWNMIYKCHVGCVFVCVRIRNIFLAPRTDLSTDLTDIYVGRAY